VFRTDAREELHGSALTPYGATPWEDPMGYAARGDAQPAFADEGKASIIIQ
jgi:hypothetical protein